MLFYTPVRINSVSNKLCSFITLCSSIVSIMICMYFLRSLARTDWKNGLWPKISVLRYKSPRAHLHVVGTLRFMSFSLPTPFYSVPVSIFFSFMALPTAFHSKISPDSSPLSHSVLPVLFLPYWSFQLYIFFMKVSLSPNIIICDWD